MTVSYTHLELGEGEAIDTSIPADPNVKNYSYAIVDGQVYYRENSRMVRPDPVSYTHLDVYKRQGLIPMQRQSRKPPR